MDHVGARLTKRASGWVIGISAMSRLRQVISCQLAGSLERRDLRLTGTRPARAASGFGSIALVRFVIMTRHLFVCLVRSERAPQ